jgi:homoserine kinase type II
MIMFTGKPIESGMQRRIAHLLERWYALGKVVHVEQMVGGYVNKSFAVWGEKKGQQMKYFLRQYAPGITAADIRFEQALICHLRKNGFSLAADIIRGRDGITFVHSRDDGAAHGSYWAVFEFLSGEDTYSWTQTNLTNAEFQSSAEILAHLHHAGYGFQTPPEADRLQPRIMEFLATFPAAYQDYARQAGQRTCDRVFLGHLDRIIRTINACLSFNDHVQGCLELPVHGDYHPGNLKYQGYKVVGVFDFDWSNVDYRLFDVALSLVYFVSIWRGETAVSLRLDMFELFLTAYHQTCRTLDGIAPLSLDEQDMLVPMLTAANVYVLNWELVNFYRRDDPDDAEYFTYIDHNLRLMSWIEENRDTIDRAIWKACK